MRNGKGSASVFTCPRALQGPAPARLAAQTEHKAGSCLHSACTDNQRCITPPVFAVGRDTAMQLACCHWNVMLRLPERGAALLRLPPLSRPSSGIS